MSGQPLHHPQALPRRQKRPQKGKRTSSDTQHAPSARSPTPFPKSRRSAHTSSMQRSMWHRSSTHTLASSITSACSGAWLGPDAEQDKEPAPAATGKAPAVRRLPRPRQVRSDHAWTHMPVHVTCEARAQSPAPEGSLRKVQQALRLLAIGWHASCPLTACQAGNVLQCRQDTSKLQRLPPRTRLGSERWQMHCASGWCPACCCIRCPGISSAPVSNVCPQAELHRRAPKPSTPPKPSAARTAVTRGGGHLCKHAHATWLHRRQQSQCEQTQTAT